MIFFLIGTYLVPPHSSPTLGVVSLFIFSSHSDRCVIVSHGVLSCTSLMTNVIEHLFTNLHIFTYLWKSEVVYLNLLPTSFSYY